MASGMTTQRLAAATTFSAMPPQPTEERTRRLGSRSVTPVPTASIVPAISSPGANDVQLEQMVVFDEEHIGEIHTASGDLDENFAGFRHRRFDLFEYQSLRSAGGPAQNGFTSPRSAKPSNKPSNKPGFRVLSLTTGIFLH
jgi:hypothetical protein